MTNIQAFDLMLRLFTTADLCQHAVKAGNMPTQDDLQKLLRGISRTSELIIYKMMEDDNIPEWEIDERFKAALDEFRTANKRSEK
jgi:hypothetical protein